MLAKPVLLDELQSNAAPAVWVLEVILVQRADAAVPAHAPPEVVVVLLRVVHRGDARVRLVEAHMGAYVAEWDGIPDDEKDLEREGALERLAWDQGPRD